MKRGRDDSIDCIEAFFGETKRRKIDPTDDADPQTSAASSQALDSSLQYPSAAGTASRLVSAESSIYDEFLEPPINEAEQRFLDLPDELKDYLLSVIPDHNLRESWLRLNGDSVLDARKSLFEETLIEYNWYKRKVSDVDGVRIRALCDLLEKCPHYIEDIQFLTIIDNAVPPDTRVLNETDDDLDSDPFAPGSSQVETMEPEKWNKSPGHFFHDGALASILSKLTNVCDISFRANGYMLDFQQYDEEYSGALSHVLNLPTLTSINLRGVSRIPLSKLDNLPLLNRLSLSFFGLEEPVASDTPPDDLDADSLLVRQPQQDPVSPSTLNVSDMRHGLDCFRRFIIDPASNIDFSHLTLLNTDLHSVEDITLLGHLLVACSGTLEFLRMSTKTLRRPVNSTPHQPNTSLSPIMFSNLTSLKTLELRLNLRSPLGDFDELKWFTKNIESLPPSNSLQKIEFTIDVTNFPPGRSLHEFSDKNDLEACEGWEAMDAALVGDNMNNLTRFVMIICSCDKELFHYNGLSLTDDIRLPRLQAKGPYSTREEFDITRRPVPRHDSFIELG